MAHKNKKDNLVKEVFVTQTYGYADIASKRKIWEEFAIEIKGKFKVLHTVSRDIQIFELSIPFRESKIKFNESDTHPFKVFCEIKSNKDINFSVSKEDVFEKILKIFGQQDIQLNDPEFDKKYIIKGNNVEITVEILNYKTIKELIVQYDVFSISCDYNKKDEKLNLMMLIGREVNSKEKMKDLYSLATSIVEKLEMFL